MAIGTLNRKLEYQTNQLYRLEVTSNTYEVERDLKQEFELRQFIKKNVSGFIDVMKNVANKETDRLQRTVTNPSICCRKQLKRVKNPTSQLQKITC